MVKSLYSGVSGLKTHQQRMDVIGNNIANVNTTAYKTNVTTFADVYYQTKRTPSAATATLGGVNPRQVGYGVKMNSTTPNMTQSGFTYSDNIYDMAIDGEGFFQVMDGSGNIFYTRAGIFNIDEEGYLVNASGYHVLGISGDSTGQNPSSEIIRAIIPATEAKCSSATKEVNGTKVTLSASAPSNNTDMSVTFTEAEFPYATYSNGILNIYFNSDIQYESQEDFELAISQALQAGGVTLPDDVELKFDFEEIPSNSESVAARNSVSGLKFSTDNASCVFDAPYGTGNSKHAYIGFAVDDNTAKDNIKIVNGGATGTAGATYTAGSNGAAGTWTITIYQDTTAADINKAIKTAKEGTAGATDLTLTGFVIPEDADRAATLTAWAGQTKVLEGIPEGSTTTGAFDFDVQEKGEFANSYKIVFAYTSGYGKTKAVWDENTLTVNVCNDTTIADVNNAIKTAANGNVKKIIKFNDISGLDYGTGYDGSKATKDANGNVTAAPTAKTNVWNPGIREAFFGGNPSVSPMGGEDSFFTKTAKSLSTFALTDGRTGSDQFYKDLSDVTIQTDGTIIGKHPVHGDLVLGRIDIATFDNPNGLSQVGGTMFAETVASGQARLCVAGSDGAGEILTGALEMSNVDLSQEFTDMITTQRGFQANSRVITVSDTMLEELLSLKR